MALEWLPRDDELKDHSLIGTQHWGTEAPCTVYEKRPLTDPQGNAVDDLYVAWIRLNNPAQFNSYTTEMVKGVIAGFTAASGDRSVVAVVFTGTGERAFCTGGNTIEYSQYYSKRPNEYGEYMDLFNMMVDAVLNCKKPVICRVNGMRIAGGQELGTACDLAISADTAVFGQAGPRHGSAAVGGITDFLPWFLSIEDAMWSTISCDLWSAYKMKNKGLISKVIPVLQKDSAWVRNPLVRTDAYLEDGEVVYGEPVTGDAAKAAKELLKACTYDFSRLDAAVNDITWRMANLFPDSLQMSIDMVRAKKKFFWDQSKLAARHWLGANMMSEAFLGFHAFSTRKLTGEDLIDFIKFRQQIANGRRMDDDSFAEVMPKPLAE
jgi:6-oxo-cyclohex-1-ene-carbonyl-CoA hydrolase